MEAANIHLAHHVPGRVRFHVPKAKGNRRLSKLFDDIALAVPGVQDVHTNPVTGSVIFRYRAHDAAVREQLAQALKDADRMISIAVPEISEAKRAAEILEPEAKFLESRFPVVRRISASLQASDRQIKKATGGALDLNILLPLAVAAWMLLAGAKERPLLILALGLAAFHAYANAGVPATHSRT